MHTASYLVGTGESAFQHEILKIATLYYTQSITVFLYT